MYHCLLSLVTWTISVFVCCGARNFAFSFTIPLKIAIKNKWVLRGETSEVRRDSRRSDTYNLGLTPYIPSTDKGFEHQDSHEMMFLTNLTQNEEPLSYPYLLQRPDHEPVTAAQNSTKQAKVPKPLFLDEWMMQLPSKWAAFMSEGENRDIYSFSNLFSSPHSKNMSQNLDMKTLNVSDMNRSVDDINDIGTFEASDHFNKLWDAISNKTVLQKQLQNDTVGQNKSKITRSSTQPQSIFTNNLYDPKKNATTGTNTMKYTSSKPLYQHPLLMGKDPNELITVADLEAILRYNNYYSRSLSLSNEHELQHREGKKSLTASSTSSSQKLSKGGVAFPQPSALSTRSIKWGATISGGLMGMLLAVSGAPNLWLVGILCGSGFGYETTKQLPVNDSSSVDFNVVQTMVIYVGRILAFLALRVYDTFQAFFFMYKTGQLSYEYYKTYAALDKRLSIQKKIDSWNARFVEGKLAFDRWEKENEVGRKVLAGLRTVWLVGEQNVRKRSGLLRRSQRYQSRYRIVQFFYDAIYTIIKLCESFWNSIIQGEISSKMRNFVRGSVSDDGGKVTLTQSHFRGVFLSIVTVNVIGALFTISPVILSVAAAAVGFIWPTWVFEMINRTGNYFEETVVRGTTGSTGRKSKIKISQHNHIAMKQHEKSRYHFYRSADGKKRYYRVGEPWIVSQFQRRDPAPKQSIWTRIFHPR